MIVGRSEAELTDAVCRPQTGFYQCRLNEKQSGPFRHGQPTAHLFRSLKPEAGIGQQVSFKGLPKWRESTF